MAAGSTTTINDVMRALTVGDLGPRVSGEDILANSPATVTALDISTSPIPLPQLTASTGSSALWSIKTRLRHDVQRPARESPADDVEPDLEEALHLSQAASVQTSRHLAVCRSQPWSRPPTLRGREDRLTREAAESRSRSEQASRECCPLCAPEAMVTTGPFCELCVALLNERGTEVVEVPRSILYTSWDDRIL